MAKSVVVQARMEPELKQEAEAILTALGMTSTTAITLFYTQLVRERGIPFELKIPKNEIEAAMQEIRDPEFRKKAQVFHKVDDLMTDLLS